MYLHISRPSGSEVLLDAAFVTRGEGKPVDVALQGDEYEFSALRTASTLIGKT